jgi:fibronectin type 3 domain-containing protein
MESKKGLFSVGIIASLALSLALSCTDTSTGKKEEQCVKPAAPSAVLTSALSSTSIRVTWASVDAASFYHVFRSVTQSGAYTRIETVFGTNYNDTGLTSATTYYYRISGENDCGEGEKSNYASETTVDCPAPGVPTPRAEPLSSTSIRVSWDSIPNASSYTVYRSVARDGAYSDSIANTAGRSFTHTGLSPSQTYYYKVAAINSCGKSGQSSYTSATTEACPKPVAPTNLSTVRKSSSSIEISWDEVSTAVNYKIYRSATSTGTYAHIGTTNGKGSVTFTDTELGSATTYYYKVAAESDCEESAMSNYAFASTECDIIPPAPSSVTAEALSSTEITISWSSVSGANTYIIYYATDGVNGNYRRLTSVLNSYSSRTITSFNPATTYYFRVASANNCDEESAKSTSYASATTDGCDLPIPPSPTGLFASPLSSKSVEIEWDEVSGASQYIVFRGTERGSTFWSIGRTRNTFFTDTTASPSMTYYYSVISENACGGQQDHLGDVVEATTLCESPVPTNVAAAPRSSSSLEVTWDEVSGAASYSVYRASSATGVYMLLGKTATNMYTDTGLASLTTYFYKITAKTEVCDDSRLSGSGYATTQ